MIDFTIDTSDLSQEFSLTKNDVDSLLEKAAKDVTAAFARLWDNEARDTLKGTRAIYRNSIQVTSAGRFTGVAYLNPASWLANALEMGLGSFDMKPGFLNSSKVVQGKNGPYLTIPFQFAVPGSQGDNGIFSGVMPDSVYKAVVKNPMGSGLKLNQIDAQYQIPKSPELRQKIKSVGFDKLEQNTQMTSIYEGLSRSAKGSGYVNFRRVSLNSSTQSFIHPGFSPYNLADKALSQLNIPHEVDISIDGFLNELGFV
jgi:hypothetical protein